MFPIEEMVREAKRKKIKQFPVNSNRASDWTRVCEIPCSQQDKMAGKSVTQRRTSNNFDLGNEFEKIIIRDLEEAEMQ